MDPTTASPPTPNREPELLAPGGSLEKARIALLYGADAVYVGGRSFSLRAFARNFNREELAAVRYLTKHLGRKVYITVNVFPRETDLARLPPYLEYLGELGVDGIIVSDPGVARLAVRWAPGVPIHVSTQANTTNSESVMFWEQLGARRVNLARELSFDEVRLIRERTDLELEVFVHGAMCISYSGRCLWSAFVNRRPANRGHCTQPCRWSYALVEEKRPGEFFPVEEDALGTYVFNSRDLCTIDDLGRLMGLGLAAFKIEGRMKGALYLAAVVRTYREALDRYRGIPDAYRVDPRWREDLDRMSHRPYTRGLLFSEAESPLADTAPSVAYVRTHTLAGLVRPFPDGAGNVAGADPVTPPPDGADGHWTCMEVRTRLMPGRILEFLYPDGRTRSHVISCMEDLEGRRLNTAHPNCWIRIALPFPTFPLQVVRTVAE